MKGITRVFWGEICLVVTALITGCLDRSPAPICPVPIEVSSTEAMTARFDGVDLLVVVDNSGSMEKEQQILSTGFFTLINSLAKPLSKGDWDYPPVENIRVAFVSSDMGFQYGKNRETALSPKDSYCENLTGDDGRFLSKSDKPTTPVLSGAIECEPDGGQCPTGYKCDNGTCMSISGDDLLVCNFKEQTVYAETQKSSPNPMFAERLACLARQGTEGCPFEQQLEASVRALEHDDQKAFLKNSHLLAVLMVSDEEDCSISNPELFKTKDWNDPDFVNMACNRNGEMLFDTARYKKALIEAKGDQADAVIFAAIVGVPTVEACQGTGSEIKAAGCLGLDEMQLVNAGSPSYHFEPACDRYDTEGNELTTARPGRRFVEVAEDFGDNGYVYSICNQKWGPAMQTIAGIIARQIEPTCYPKQLEWEVLSDEDQSEYPHCEGCGWAKCDVVMRQFVEEGQEPESVCDEALYAGLSPAMQAKYKDMITIEKVEKGGANSGYNVTCPIPKMPTTLDCDTARGQMDTLYGDQAGWFYCERNNGMVGQDSCNDGVDNNGNNKIDCEDRTCADSVACGGSDSSAQEGCQYGVELNQMAKDLSANAYVAVECLQRIEMQDENCQEDSPRICADGKDNDGNGLWDCDTTLSDPTAADPHMAEPACCPMDVIDGKCVPLMPEIEARCGNSPKLAAETTAFWADPSNARMVDACLAQKEVLGCEW